MLELLTEMKKQNKTEHWPHRRRLKTEEKAKVVAVVWGAELIKFLATLAFLNKDNLKYRMNCIRVV